MKTLYTDYVATPIGDVLLVADGESLVYVDFADNTERLQRLLARRYRDFTLIQQEHPNGFSDQIKRYFAGELDALNQLPVALGGTPFQQRVWLKLRDILVGQTMSYGQLATQLGLPKGARAVGITNGLNPIGIVLPCHRVIGANHSLTGYAGGIERKRWLLRHEGAMFKDN
ncbi:MAG: methylated-DNA--[protein]-cysteine S-methyltransferase [Chloroflexi bacterium AL-W]|nr:methylated-DNA--[protein]-cysteine S-methyltransferase [Chloroflexi bacterium AL-N1]NOK68603.1 methylated-DNA--[protein]-cysteine S-methyltransferase [Chloroflexi bacterium AL-N10]NOK76089.1 methylated-DNA--[protein]-cysteine S-methyltransferase [Chloroflexi bacterium AL-N5]NOK82562.1 methylated-DNA--[protein]-cysteine S-methyltransferase [Chloroflexi bacterium AL-W]NOK93360.1 methylated-DNA--[protein]-cysteine S-methyltransferase [Chloroflexi bacterium AL-N15]